MKDKINFAEKYHKIMAYRNIFNKEFYPMKLEDYVDKFTGFDVIAFDKALQKTYKYDEETTSLSDFLTERFGKNTNKIIRNLIEM